MKFSVKLGVASVILAILTAVIAVMLSYHYSEKVILPRELKVLERSASLVTERVNNVIEDTRLQVLAIAATPPIQGIIRARGNDDTEIDPYDGTTEALWIERLQTIFAGHLNANPNYLQIRYIGLEDGGREIVRVERQKRRGAIQVVTDDALAQKGQRDYFQEGMDTPDGEVYLSPIELNRENNEIVEPYVPTIRVAVKVNQGVGRPFGLVIINVDLREVFSEAAILPIAGGQVFLANQDGDFLYHPDTSKIFGSEFERPGLLWEQFANARLLSEQTSASTIEESGSEERLAVGYGEAHISEDQAIYAIVTMPYQSIVASLAEIRKSGLIAAVLTSLLAVIFSLILARTIAGPLARITNAVQSYSFMNTISLPKSTTSEFNLLAQALEKMAAKIQDQAVEIESESKERIQTEARSETRSAFLANMSHEIRTPMNGVVGMTDMLNQTELTSEQRQYTEVLARSASLLLAVIDDILDFSKIEAGKLKIEAVSLDLRILVDDIMRLLSPKADEKRLELVAEIDPAIPEKVIGDPVRIRQILINLVGNALKFTTKGTVTLSLSVKNRKGNQAVLRFQVKDTGVGIAPERLDLIFESFAQADDSTTRNFGGSGLGLTISRSLVNMMGGHMRVESQLGQGSCFYFDLPVVDVSSAPANQVEVLEDSPDGLDVLQTKLVLVAEDNEVNQFVVSKVLERIGCDFDIVSDGEQAVEIVQKRPYDLIFMDCHMPVMDGMEATVAIRALGGKFAKLPIVALTAGVMDEDIKRCEDAGMNDHMAKPVRFPSLCQMLSKYLA